MLVAAFLRIYAGDQQPGHGIILPTLALYEQLRLVRSLCSFMWIPRVKRRRRSRTPVARFCVDASVRVMGGGCCGILSPGSGLTS